jgi:Uma2 family endonuclease
MRTLLPDPPPRELQDALEALLARRRQWGADTHDEVWEGVLHMNPAAHWRHANLQAQLLVLLAPHARAARLHLVGEINLGEADDYRVPDGALTQDGSGELYNPTAALVIEVLSPGDETTRKLPFYAAHHVAELLIVDPDRRTVRWLALGAGPGPGYRDVTGSAPIDLTASAMNDAIDWPR